MYCRYSVVGYLVCNKKRLNHKVTEISYRYSTVQYSTVQYSTVQYSTVQYSTTAGNFQHVHFIPTVGVGKRGEYQLVHGDLPSQHSFGTTLRFTGPVPADSRQ